MATKSILPWNWGRKGNGGSPIQSVHDEMDRLFEGFFGSPSWPAFRETRFQGVAFPKIDLTETDKEIRLTADLPGLEEKDIQVLVNRDLLTLKGERKDEREEKGGDYYFSERSFGAFERTFPLPAEVDGAKVEATLKKGVLTITMPKTPEARKDTKKVEIKSA